MTRTARQRFGPFELVGEIGRGGMAVVYEAIRLDDDRCVALKIPLAHLASDGFRELFEHEARISRLVSHANVVSVLDSGEVEGTPYLAMALVRGANLSDLHARARNDPEWPAFALLVLAELAAGLAAAHSARSSAGTPLGLVHRDVNPENVLIGRDGTIRLADFGIANTVDRRRLTRTGELRGKLAYLAPEQITREQPTTSAADIWALGVTGYRLIAGELPFRGDNDAQLLWAITQAAPAVPEPSPLVPPNVWQLVLRALQKDPARRVESAAAFAEALALAAANAGATPAAFRAKLAHWLEPELQRDRSTAKAGASRSRALLLAAVAALSLLSFAAVRVFATGPGTWLATSLVQPVVANEGSRPAPRDASSQAVSVPISSPLEAVVSPAPRLASPPILAKSRGVPAISSTQAPRVESAPERTPLMRNPYP